MKQANPKDTFLHEASDLLAQIEETALDMQSGTTGAENVNQLFRAFHTIKGSGSMFGFNALAEFTHHIESALDRLRDGALPIPHGLPALVLSAKDHIQGLLVNEDPNACPPEGQAIIDALAGLFEGAEAAAVVEAAVNNWRIRFSLHPEVLLRGTNPVLLLNELRAMGPCEVTACTDEVPELDTIRPDHCYLSWDVKLRASASRNDIQDVFIFVEDESEISIDRLPDTEEPAAVTLTLTPEMPDSNQPVPEARKTTLQDSTVRVPSSKLDRLVNLVGELVMNQSRLSQAASRLDVSDLAAPVEEIERLVAELRDSVLGIRMMPIGSTFTRFKRLVHDLSLELGKEIDLVTEGAETELDKTVLDQLGDPLVHLIRNSIDHGIEPAEQRVMRGKSSRGMVRLSAVHTGSNVVVSIRDDGSGLDPARIRAKAIERQVISADASLSEKEIFNLIFLPGFSTARQVTSVSGRGVGMDVVKRQIDALRGSVNIDSELGRGTTISLTLPLTLAIIDGLLVEIERSQYIIPMSAVSENVELQRQERWKNNGRNTISVRGDLIPYIHLREAFAIAGPAPDVEKIVIVRHGDQRVGLVVDRVLGSHQTVIQSLGRFYKQIAIVSGATIMGDGRVALILDLSGLIAFANQPAVLNTRPHMPLGNQAASHISF